MSKKFWKIKNNADNDEESAELLLYGTIANETWWGDEVTPKQFADDIRSLGGKDIIVRINSGGGDVFAAQAIYNQLKSYAGNVDVVIDGICASAATIISCAGKNVSMPNNAIFMIHNPSVGVCDWFTAQDLESMAKQLDKVKQTIVNVYLSRCRNATEKQLKNMMDKETWLTADEALSYGFIDSVADVSAEMKDISNKIVGIRNFKSSADIRQMATDKRKEGVEMQKNDILTQIKNLLNGGSSEPVNQVDPVMAERERMLALDALNDGSEVVAQMINIAKQNGNTAEEISEYVNAVKTQTANSSRDKGIAEIKKLVQDNISSGATQIAASPADNTANDIANQEKQKQFDDVLAAMNK